MPPFGCMKLHKTLFGSIVFDLSHAICHSDALTAPGDDPLDAPVLMGPKGRSVNISIAQKIATMAGRREVFKSGQGVVKGMKLLGERFGTGGKSAINWIDPLAHQYLHRLQATLKL